MKKGIIYFSIFLLSLLVLLSIDKPISAAPQNNPIFATVVWVEGKFQHLLNVFNQHEQQNQTDFDFINQRAENLESRIEYLESLLIPTPTTSPSIIFEENFDGEEIDSDKWEYFANGGSYVLQNGLLKLNGGGSGLPFIRTKGNPFPESGPFEIEFGIQYTLAQPSGSGVGVSFIQQENAHEPANQPLSFWEDSASGLEVVRFGLTVVDLGGNDYDYHVVKEIYNGDNFQVYLDDVLVYTSPNTNMVESLWVGHPYASVSTPWTGFNLDYVKVKDL